MTVIGTWALWVVVMLTALGTVVELFKSIAEGDSFGFLWTIILGVFVTFGISELLAFN